MQNKVQFKWLVCMTTLPERLTSRFMYRVLYSIFSQKTSCNFQIALFVPHRSLRTGMPYPDPSFLHARYGNDRLVIHRCDDVGPATKFAGLLTHLPLVDKDITHIYIADDDIILRDHAFQRMLDRLLARSAVTESVHRHHGPDTDRRAPGLVRALQAHVAQSRHHAMPQGHIAVASARRFVGRHAPGSYDAPVPARVAAIA